MSSKVCRKCKQKLHVNGFCKTSKYKDGLNSICRSCNRIECAKWRAKQTPEERRKKYLQYSNAIKRKIQESPKEKIVPRKYASLNNDHLQIQQLKQFQNQQFQQFQQFQNQQFQDIYQWFNPV